MTTLQYISIKSITLFSSILLASLPLISQEEDKDSDVKTLVEELRITDFDRAQRAKLSLIAKGKTVVPYLLDILADYHPGLKDRIEELASKLSDEKWSERDAATKKLISIGAVAKTHLEEIIKEKSPEVAWRMKSILTAIQENALEEEQKVNNRNVLICEILSEIGNASCGKLLIEKLQDKDINVRISAVAALGKLKITDAEEPLTKAIEGRKDWRERSIIIWSLSRLKAKSAMTIAKKILTDENENVEVKDKCLLVLVSINSSESIKLMLEQLSSEIPHIRAKTLKYITILTKDTFGYDPNIAEEERAKALSKFETWWQKNYSN